MSDLNATESDSSIAADTVAGVGTAHNSATQRNSRRFEPASRATRFASALIDAALYGIAPLVPALIVSIANRREVPVRLFDDLTQMKESFQKGPFDSVGARLALCAPIVLLLLAQWLSVARSAAAMARALP